MKFFALVLTAMTLTACSGGIFSSPPSRSNLIGNGQAADGSQVDTSASGSAAGNVDNGNSSSKTAGTADAAGTAGTTVDTTNDTLAKAMQQCPGIDPVVLDQLIKSGQPFEVECEIEIEVGEEADD